MPGFGRDRSGYGHTPGSVIVFAALPGGKRYALIGDLVWRQEGIRLTVG